MNNTIAHCYFTTVLITAIKSHKTTTLITTKSLKCYIISNINAFISNTCRSKHIRTTNFAGVQTNKIKHYTVKLTTAYISTTKAKSLRILRIVT